MELEIINLNKSYGNIHAICDMSLHVTPGVWGLIGANGAGKTTLMRILAGIMNPSSGKVLYNNEDITVLGKHYRDVLGYLPQNFGYYVGFTVNDYLEYIATLKGINRSTSRTRIDELLNILSLTDCKYKKIRKLSGGMQRRVGIAQSMLNNPKVLILDEPTSGLDPVIRNEVLDLFLEFIQDEQHTILFSTHITSDLEHISDYIIFLDQGQIVLQEERDVLQNDYGILKCGLKEFEQVDPKDYLYYKKGKYQCEMLVKEKHKIQKKYKNMVMDPITLEELMILTIKGVKSC